MKKVRIKIELNIENDDISDTDIDSFVDKLREFTIEQFDGYVSGEITNDLSGTTAEICVPRCPECGHPLTYLVNEQDLLVRWKFYRNGEYSTVPDTDDMMHLGELNRWVCPYCEHVISENEDDALAFLLCEKGGDNE